ncbi:2OG-Fe(II) oxygenase [Amylibacter sp.]|nr:2OG-Fe(II) oxygenase [Amylibacter sp.]
MHDILDLTRFPIDRPDTPEWQNLVDRCRADIVADGMFNLDGLLRPAVAAEVAVGLMPKFEAESFEHARMHNIYFKKSIPDVADDHPALTQFETSNRTLCGDQLGQGALMALYEWPPFAQFLAACMGKETLHTMADPLARVNVMAYREGQALNWHFDRSEFTTTLLLQAPEQGGGFEYCSNLRSEDDPNYDGVARLLRGQEATREITLSAGTLNVFAGKNTAHRVTPVEGGTDRVIAVFSYYETPDVMFSEEERVGFYGRAS